MLRTVLVALKPSQTQECVIAFAADLARRHNLTIEAYSVVDLEALSPPQTVPIGGGAYKLERDRERLDSASHWANEVLSQMQAAATQRALRCQTHLVSGPTVATLATAAQTCDLLICGHTAGGDSHEGSLLTGILKHSCRPTIVVPQGHGDQAETRTDVLVAYDGSYQSSRALASFVETGLAANRVIHVVSFPGGACDPAMALQTAQTYLERHGLVAKLIIGSPQGGAMGQRLLAQAQLVGAGMLVMGAFAHGAIHQWFFGSVTRTVLDGLSLPVFLEH